MNYYNEERSHLGRYCYGETPMEIFIDLKQITKEKQISFIGHIKIMNENEYQIKS